MVISKYLPGGTMVRPFAGPTLSPAPKEIRWAASLREVRALRGDGAVVEHVDFPSRQRLPGWRSGSIASALRQTVKGVTQHAFVRAGDGDVFQARSHGKADIGLRCLVCRVGFSRRADQEPEFARIPRAMPIALQRRWRVRDRGARLNSQCQLTRSGERRRQARRRVYSMIPKSWRSFRTRSCNKKKEKRERDQIT